MGGKKYRIKLSDATIDELVRAKREGATVRKLIYGLTAEQYGHVYSVGGYRMTCHADPDEIRKALKKTKRGVGTR